MGELLFWLIVAGIGFLLWRRARRRRRARVIAAYRFPDGLTRAVRQRYDHLSPADARRVTNGLRDYFLDCNRGGRKMLAMPSQVVDEAWHAFILNTRAYDTFCRQGLGRFLHHAPAEAMQSQQQAQDGIKRAWRLACQREGINPQQPNRLPLLFALDTELNIPDGFAYSLNCSGKKGEYCAGHIGCGGIMGCGGDTDSSGCGGGCGGGD